MAGWNHGKRSNKNDWIRFKYIIYSKSRSHLIITESLEKLDKIREMIALINTSSTSRHDYVKVVSIASSTSLQDDDGALKKGVELAHVKNGGVEEMSKSQKGASRGPGPALHPGKSSD